MPPQHLVSSRQVLGGRALDCRVTPCFLSYYQAVIGMSSMMEKQLLLLDKLIDGCEAGRVAMVPARKLPESLRGTYGTQGRKAHREALPDWMYNQRAFRPLYLATTCLLRKISGQVGISMLWRRNYPPVA